VSERTPGGHFADTFLRHFLLLRSRIDRPHSGIKIAYDLDLASLSEL
jgi:hypothetical protein